MCCLPFYQHRCTYLNCVHFAWNIVARESRLTCTSVLGLSPYVSRNNSVSSIWPVCGLFTAAWRSLYVGHLTSLCRYMCRGVSPRRASVAAVGVVRNAPVINRHACLCRLDNFAWARRCWPFFHQTTDLYVIIGLMTITYSQYICLGFIPQVLPQILRHAQSAWLAFRMIFSKCEFQLRVLSSVTPSILLL